MRGQWTKRVKSSDPAMSMRKFTRIFALEIPRRPVAWGDAVVLLAIGVLIYFTVVQARQAPSVVRGPEISLDPRALPLYTILSTGRLFGAYVLSLLFTAIYGCAAARSRQAETILIPILDVLQSVPLLSFIPLLLLGFSTVFSQRVAAEISSMVLIFTCQGWNITFAWYQALTTVPRQLREVGRSLRFNGWMNFRTVLFPFAAVSLVWNSMVSWANGWFFLMAAEMFSVGSRDFRLPGLGAYLQEAANRGDLRAMFYGITTLVVVVVALDQLVWRPLVVWSDRFRLEMVQNDYPPKSWFYDALQASRIVRWFSTRVLQPMADRLDRTLVRAMPVRVRWAQDERRSLVLTLGAVSAIALTLYGAAHAARMMAMVAAYDWWTIAISILATFLRVVVALAISLAWTIPVGVAIGTNRKLAAWCQPLVQIVASIPATALFPAFLLVMLNLPAGLNLAAVSLMMAGTQWYLLFNVIAGASTIPEELKNTAALLHFDKVERWRTLILPAIFPYVVTGAITAGGGAWNASIVAEYTKFGGHTYNTVGIGALIAQATAEARYPLLLAATMTMIATVVLINRFFWQRLYRTAAEKYRLE